LERRPVAELAGAVNSPCPQRAVALRARVWFAPAARVTQVVATPIRTGAWRWNVVPSPSWPKPL